MHLFKKIANVALALLILASTTGITLHKHYCMGKLRNVALMHKADNCMGESDMEMPFDCCKDTVEEFKVDDLNKIDFNFDVSPDFYLISALAYYIFEINLETNLSGQTAFLNYKPPLIEQDIYIQVQSILC